MSGRGDQEELAFGSLEDWRVFWMSLGDSELLRVPFKTHGGVLSDASKVNCLQTDRQTDGRTD